MHVRQYLADRNIPFETLVHPPAFTAQKRAKYLRVPGRLVAKAVLLYGPRDYFLAVLPATRRIDTEALSRQLGGPIRIANEQEIASVFRDCEWGVVPPFGGLYALKTVLDETIDPDSVLVFEGNSHGVAVRLHCRDYLALEQPRRLAFSRSSSCS
jgi:Ala-tRNA(Pro) deacylase